jgi:hypothetical protein
MNVLTDTDFPVTNVCAKDLVPLETDEAWLLAYVGQALLHNNHYFDAFAQKDITKRPDMVGVVNSVLELIKSDHWESSAVTAGEATAITGAFLSHSCTLHLSTRNKSNPDVPSVRDTVLKWAIARQRPSGSWVDSPHVTAHCLKLVDAALVELPADHPQRGEASTTF